jgi:8-oxo-dGTP pyrophosphatase MutT (NUDIX family)
MSDEPLRPWVVRSSTYRIDEPFLRVRSDTVELPSGVVIENYFVRENRGFAIVAALTAERRVVMVRQYKHGVAQVVLELPAGMIDPGETPAECAVRELAEETGYAGDAPVLLRSLFADPTGSDSVFHVFLIENVTAKFAQALDTTEAIVIETMSLEELRAAVRDGGIASGSQVAAVFLLFDHLHGRDSGGPSRASG